MEAGDIADVVLVGGSSRIPKIASMLRTYFGSGVTINNQVDPDIVVATGATVMAGIVSGRLQ